MTNLNEGQSLDQISYNLRFERVSAAWKGKE